MRRQKTEFISCWRIVVWSLVAIGAGVFIAGLIVDGLS